MLLHLLETERNTLVVNRLETHQLMDARRVCKSFHAAVDDFEKKAVEAIKRFTQVQTLSVQRSPPHAYGKAHCRVQPDQTGRRQCCKGVRRPC
jgi:hypothetical protein